MLDRVDFSHRSFIGIEPCANAGPPLSQEIPALVKSVFQPPKPLSILLGKLATALALAKLVFFVRQLLDVEQDVVAGQNLILLGEGFQTSLRGWTSNLLLIRQADAPAEIVSTLNADAHRLAVAPNLSVRRSGPTTYRGRIAGP